MFVCFVCFLFCFVLFVCVLKKTFNFIFSIKKPSNPVLCKEFIYNFSNLFLRQPQMLSPAIRYLSDLT